ncbi:FecR family protein [Pontibacter ummariensis]|uniref:FecR family protein n=1 Tax=Pontibacter ummariensis TaxID=1610492 RepID=A0A239B7J1_9BACT|nr:FecR family protein [Pontibacter ummariensis]PRY16366.1 FecR family protein [Pontibacter ummariensis]SNS03917.1 FecR family protein [Pontibacter ummariensis]
MNRDLLDRFYRGECSQEEVRAVLKWFQANNLAPQQEQELYAMWHEAGQVSAGEQPLHDAGSAYSKILSRIKDAKQEEESCVTYSFPRQQPQFWLKVAAAIVLPLCLAWAFVHYTTSRSTPVATYVSVTAEPGVKKTIHLPDGSRVKLNSGSEVTFRKDFALHGKRDIQLRGEAFFEVAKDSLRPFIVHTGAISTEALGTSFNINYDICNGATRVALATGGVRVDKQGHNQRQELSRLVPGQQLAYDKASRKYSVSGYNATEVLGWQEGVLYFKKDSMDQVVKKLEKWYGVDIEVEAKHLQDNAWNYTGAYDNESLERVLEGIGFVKDFTYERTKDKVKIVFN